MNELRAILLQTAPLLLVQIAITVLSCIKTFGRRRRKHRAQVGHCAHCRRSAPSPVSREFDRWDVSSRDWACPTCQSSRPKRSAR
jgi:hypothetical protein